MHYLKSWFSVLLLVVSLALAGCGGSGSGSGTAADPLASGTTGGGGTVGGGGGGTQVSSSGVIMFTSAASAVPGSQTSMLEPYDKTVDPTIIPAVSVLQLIPFKLTDSNGNPRVGVPVTMYVYSINPTKNPNDVTIDFLVPTTIEGAIIGPNPEPNQQTITTDSAGMGIFNVSTGIVSPSPGSFTALTVVFKAVTNDAVPVTAFVGRQYSLTSNLPTLTIAPSTASFGTGTDITFTIAGGFKPYTVSSSNSGRVTATLQADGTTVLAHLVDTTAWTGAVTISAIDSAGQTVSATVAR